MEKTTRTTKVLKGAIETKVKLFDWTPIEKAFSEKLGFDVEIRAGFGIIENVTATFKKNYEPFKSNILIDNECCGLYSEAILSLNKNKVNYDDYFERIGLFKKHEKGISLFPSFFANISLKDILKNLTGEEVPLYEFMEGRYGYNHRIDNNEFGILNFVYENTKDKSWQERVTMQIPC